MSIYDYPSLKKSDSIFMPLPYYIVENTLILHELMYNDCLNMLVNTLSDSLSHRRNVGCHCPDVFCAG